MAKKFQNLSVDYTKIISKLSVGDRISMLQSSDGRQLLSNLTPYQLADMFPDYYKKRDPDVGKLLKSISDPSFKGRAYTEGEAEAFKDADRRRIRGGERITYPKPETVPSWVKKLEKETGVTLSSPGAKAQLSNEKKALLEELAKGKISGDDPRVAFLKDLSEDDLLKAGIKKQVDPEGKVLYEAAPTAASKMSESEVADKLRSEASSSFSPRERNVLDLISKREGSPSADIIFGDHGGVAGSGKYSKELGLDKRPLSDRSVAEVLELQKEMTRITRRDGVANGIGTSAVGTGQMIRGTLIGNLRALGIPESEWPNIKFDKNLQERLTLTNFKTSGIGDPNADPSTWNRSRLGQQYESLDVTKGFAGLSQAEQQKIAEASPSKPLPGPVTAESVAQKRKELEQREREQQQTFLAERTVPKTPEGLDPRMVQDIEKLSPRRKQEVIAMINKAGEGDPARGVAKLNETYRQNPSYVQESISRGNTLIPETPQQTAEPVPAAPAPRPETVAAANQQTNPVPVDVYAEGGSESVNSDEIKAMPIESLKGDNSVVVDKSNNPLFTMNTKEEQAVYNPKTRQVDVQPMSKTNPDNLGEKQTTEKMSETVDTTMKTNQAPPAPQTAVTQSSVSSTDTSVSITDELFKDPSFRRAVAKTRFVDTGDAALGGHFGMANADLG